MFLSVSCYERVCHRGCVPRIMNNFRDVLVCFSKPRTLLFFKYFGVDFAFLFVPFGLVVGDRDVLWEGVL